MTDRAQLEQAIAALEAQRAILGDAVADAALASLREKLAALQLPTVEQRKLATVLFADVSGFTALSETLDAEDITAIMNALWVRLDAVVRAHGGRIDKHIGDALMALWGADQAREDDPEQAVRAALALQGELAAFRAERALTLPMRIGVNTGPVLLGAVGSTHEFTAMGDAVNLASRLEHAAPVGGVLISHDTFRHIRGLFDVQPQPPLTVKGKREPVQTYVVTAAKARAFRMPTRGVEGVETRTIGREGELIMLQNAYRDAVEGGETRLLTVVGEAGVGKSRLLAELEGWVGQQLEAVAMLRGRAAVEGRYRSGGLLRDLLGGHCQMQDTDSPDVVRAKLTAGLAPALDANQAAVLGQAAGFDFGAVPAVQAAIGNAGFTNMAAAYLATYLRGRTETGPVLLLLEDLHWADDRSLDLLGDALAQVEHVLTHLASGSLDHTEAPMRAYLCCIEVLQAAGDARAQPLLERAHGELQKQAARMDETSRRMFLENVPSNRALMAAWAQHGERRT
jgi:class 3 adenylate cyclase